jgi:hypothetical protein
MLPMEDEEPAFVGRIEQELTIEAGQRAAFSVISLGNKYFLERALERHVDLPRSL